MAAQRTDELQALLLATFVDEARDQLEALNEKLLLLEKSPDSGSEDLLAEIFRQAHNLKGASRTVASPEIESLAHRLETLFDRLRARSLEPSAELFDTSYRTLDVIAELVEATAAGKPLERDLTAVQAELDSVASGAPPTPASDAENGSRGSTSAEPAKSEPPVSRRTDETVRIATSKLDALMVQTGELLAARAGEEQRRADLNELLRTTERLEAGGGGAPGDDGMRELREGLADLQRKLDADSRRLAQVTDDLQDDVRRARMLPVATLFEALPRTARDLGRELGKEVSLSVEGGETEVDRSVLEQLRAPLGHLVRNAIDHGLEPPAEREAAGKAPQGSVLVRATQRGSALLIEVADDGAGIDLAGVRSQAARKGLLSEAEAAALSERDALWLIFRPGFTTRSEVGGVSGRGVGMDVVRDRVERMHGMVDVDTRAGEGTTFTLNLPLSIATTRCLLVRAGGQLLGVPINNLDRIVRILPDEVGRAHGRDTVVVDGRPMVLVRLAQTLGLEDEAPFEGSRPAIVLGTGERRRAFAVDALASAQELAVKQLPPPLRRVRMVAGISILGTGEIVTVLNAADLLGSAAGAWGARRPDAAEPEAETPPPPLLVVDDSMTTRTLEKNLLEAAGYEVEAAPDGAKAWELLQRRDYALVVSDVEMPGLDGIELATKVRADERLRHLPFVLVTSLGSEQDRDRGIMAGADAYVVKGSFDQDQLLDTVRRLI